jgi:hypothetical protein
VLSAVQASGQLERLLRSRARFAAKAMVLSAAADEAATKIAVHRIGPALVFERLWEETGCRAVMPGADCYCRPITWQIALLKMSLIFGI